MDFLKYLHERLFGPRSRPRTATDGIYHTATGPNEFAKALAERTALSRALQRLGANPQEHLAKYLSVMSWLAKNRPNHPIVKPYVEAAAQIQNPEIESSYKGGPHTVGPGYASGANLHEHILPFVRFTNRLLRRMEPNHPVFNLPKQTTIHEGVFGQEKPAPVADPEAPEFAPSIRPVSETGADAFRIGLAPKMKPSKVDQTTAPSEPGIPLVNYPGEIGRTGDRWKMISDMHAAGHEPKHIVRSLSDRFALSPRNAAATYRRWRSAKKLARGNRAKIKKVMGEFKRGTLKTPDGKTVTKREQAVAIAMSEARKLSRYKNSEEEALLHAIADTLGTSEENQNAATRKFPDETPVGVLADWYDDHGFHAHAELIRKALETTRANKGNLPRMRKSHPWTLDRHLISVHIPYPEDAHHYPEMHRDLFSLNLGPVQMDVNLKREDTRRLLPQLKKEGMGVQFLQHEKPRLKKHVGPSQPSDRPAAAFLSRSRRFVLQLAKNPHIQARHLVQGVDKQIAGTRLAYHLRQIQQQYAQSDPHLSNLARMALAGTGHPDPYSELGANLKRVGDRRWAGAYRWNKMQRGLQNEALVERFIREHIKAPHLTDHQLFTRSAALFHRDAASDPTQHAGFWKRLRDYATKYGMGTKMGDKELNRALLRLSERYEDRKELAESFGTRPHKPRKVELPGSPRDIDPFDFQALNEYQGSGDAGPRSRDPNVKRPRNLGQATAYDYHWRDAFNWLPSADHMKFSRLTLGPMRTERQPAYFGRFNRMDVHPYVDEDGKTQGVIHASQEGKVLHVHWLGDARRYPGEVANIHTPADMRNLLRQLVQRYPEAEYITALRAGGARMKAPARILKPIRLSREIREAVWNRLSKSASAKRQGITAETIAALPEEEVRRWAQVLGIEIAKPVAKATPVANTVQPQQPASPSVIQNVNPPAPYELVDGPTSAIRDVRKPTTPAPRTGSAVVRPGTKMRVVKKVDYKPGMEPPQRLARSKDALRGYSDLSGLLQAVHEQRQRGLPEGHEGDETPRLALADFLDDHADPRAEIVRKHRPRIYTDLNNPFFRRAEFMMKPRDAQDSEEVSHRLQWIYHTAGNPVFDSDYRVILAHATPTEMPYRYQSPSHPVVVWSPHQKIKGSKSNKIVPFYGVMSPEELHSWIDTHLSRVKPQAAKRWKKIANQFWPVHGPSVPNTEIPSSMYNQENEPHQLARTRLDSPAAAAHTVGTENNKKKYEVARRVLNEAGITNAQVRNVLVHESNGASRASVVQEIAKEIPPDLARYVASWWGLLTHEPRVTAFHVDPKGRDTLHVIESRLPGQELSNQLNRSGLSGFAVENHQQGSRAYVFSPNNQVRIPEQFHASTTSTPGTGQRIGDRASTSADSRSAYRQTISSFETGGTPTSTV